VLLMMGIGGAWVALENRTFSILAMSFGKQVDAASRCQLLKAPPKYQPGVHPPTTSH